MTAITKIDTSQIMPGPNDRTQFYPNALAELAANIAAHGLIQPITVRIIDGTDKYEIVAGERRFRACADILNWATIPAIVADLTDEEASAVMLAENVARTDIDPIDEANAYAIRMRLYGWTVSECAQRAGVTEVRVQFRIKLLKLRPDLQALVRTSNLAIGYAQILADANLDPDRQLIAIAALRDSKSPTPPWFRRACNDLLTQQAQDTLIESLPIVTGRPIDNPTAQPIAEPPSPATHRPATNGATPWERIASQIGFWESAADQWQQLGKPFKRQECQAAMQALQFALETL